MKNSSLLKIVFVATVLISLWGATATAQDTPPNAIKSQTALDASKSAPLLAAPEKPQASDKQSSASSNLNNTLVIISLGVAVLSLASVVGLLVLILKMPKKIIESQQPVLSQSQDVLSQKLDDLKKALPKKDDFPKVEAFSSNVQALLKKSFPQNSNDDLAKSLVKALKESLKTELDRITTLVSTMPETNKSLENVVALGNDAQFALENARKDYEKEKNELLAEKKQLQSKLEAAREEEAQQTRTSVCKEMQANVDQLNTKIKSLQEEILSAKQEASDSKAKAAQADNEGYQRGLGEGTKHRDELSAANGTLSQKLEDSEKLFLAQIEAAKAQVTASVEEKWANQTGKLKEEIAEKNTHIQEYRSNLEKAEADIQQYRQRAAEQEKRVAEEKAKQEQFAGENENLKQKLDAVKTERDTAAKECADKIEENKRLLANNQEQKDRLASLENSVKTLQSAVFPESFLADSDFTPLKAHLNAWREAKIAPCEIVTANLFLFAQRELLDMDSWERALKNLSLGITLSMRQAKATEEQILSELVLWSKYLMKFADETHDFSLKIPDIDDNYDDGWMTSQNRRMTTVKRVLTWAVYHNQYGIHQLAEVE